MEPIILPRFVKNPLATIEALIDDSKVEVTDLAGFIEHETSEFFVEYPTHAKLGVTFKIDETHVCQPIDEPNIVRFWVNFVDRFTDYGFVEILVDFNMETQKIDRFLAEYDSDLVEPIQSYVSELLEKFTKCLARDGEIGVAIETAKMMNSPRGREIVDVIANSEAVFFAVQKNAVGPFSTSIKKFIQVDGNYVIEAICDFFILQTNGGRGRVEVELEINIGGDATDQALLETLTSIYANANLDS